MSDRITSPLAAIRRRVPVQMDGVLEQAFVTVLCEDAAEQWASQVLGLAAPEVLIRYEHGNTLSTIQLFHAMLTAQKWGVLTKQMLLMTVWALRVSGLMTQLPIEVLAAYHAGGARDKEELREAVHHLPRIESIEMLLDVLFPDTEKPNHTIRSRLRGFVGLVEVVEQFDLRETLADAIKESPGALLESASAIVRLVNSGQIGSMDELRTIIEAVGNFNRDDARGILNAVRQGSTVEEAVTGVTQALNGEGKLPYHVVPVRESRNLLRYAFVFEVPDGMLSWFMKKIDRYAQRVADDSSGYTQPVDARDIEEGDVINIPVRWSGGDGF